MAQPTSSRVCMSSWPLAAAIAIENAFHWCEGTKRACEIMHPLNNPRQGFSASEVPVMSRRCLESPTWASLGLGAKAFANGY